jgi:quercetin dioxygenase-like cupin family protein
MAIPHAQPGEVVDVRPLGAALAESRTHTLIKTPSLEVIRLVLPAGKTLPPHRARGEITVQCLEGKVRFSIGDVARELQAGNLLFVEAQGEHAVEALEDSSLLLTLVLPPSQA